MKFLKTFFLVLSVISFVGCAQKNTKQDAASSGTATAQSEKECCKGKAEGECELEKKGEHCKGGCDKECELKHKKEEKKKPAKK